MGEHLERGHNRAELKTGTDVHELRADSWLRGVDDDDVLADALAQHLPTCPLTCNRCTWQVMHMLYKQVRHIKYKQVKHKQHMSTPTALRHVGPRVNALGTAPEQAQDVMEARSQEAQGEEDAQDAATTPPTPLPRQETCQHSLRD